MTPRYCFSSPEGDIPIEGPDLLRPFMTAPSAPHPSLTLGDYFRAIQEFVLEQNRDSFLNLLSGTAGREIGIDDIWEIVIRSEKHGALYHVASLETGLEERKIKFAVSTALSPRAREWLDREAEVLDALNSRFGLPYLPRVHFRARLDRSSGKGEAAMSMALTEWFEGYHEWHLSEGQGADMPICLWDRTGGRLYATRDEGFEILRQAAMILTLYYDPPSRSQIHPWHHAAGDFVVKMEGGKIDVRLTTARNYGPVIEFPDRQERHPWIPVFFFFLVMTIGIRLDKWDGVGEPAWAGDFSVPASVTGFFEALGTRESTAGCYPGPPEEMLSLLKGFSLEELEALSDLLVDLCRERDEGDLALIRRNMASHIRELYGAIQNFRL